jgi:DNA-binding MarR family transcriptional regulator
MRSKGGRGRAWCVLLRSTELGNGLDISRPTLAAELVVDRTTLGRNIRPLERDDLFAIESDPSDGRSKILHLTKAGEARFQRAEKHWVEAQKRFERAYGGRQDSQLRESLRTVVASDLGPFDTMAAE